MSACTHYLEELRTTFQVDVTRDSPDVHPQSFCSSCHSVVRRHSEAVLKGLPYVQVFLWERDTENCSVRSTIRTLDQNTYVQVLDTNDLF